MGRGTVGERHESHQRQGIHNATGASVKAARNRKAQKDESGRELITSGCPVIATLPVSLFSGGDWRGRHKGKCLDVVSYCQCHVCVFGSWASWSSRVVMCRRCLWVAVVVVVVAM